MGWLTGVRNVLRRLTGKAAAAIAPGQPASIGEVIAAMERIAESGGPNDGLDAFNGMYLRVTRRVKERIAAGDFHDAAYMSRLTAIFGGLYLAAVEEGAAGRNKAWAPVLECRHDPSRLPIQFALAGMNAHINYDLPVAVVRTSRQLGTGLGTQVANDYRTVTALLEAEQEAVRQSFLSGLALEVDRRWTGPAADLVSSWSIARARDAAWTNAHVLWQLDGMRPLDTEFLDTLGRTVGMAGRLLLTPVKELA